MASTKITVTVPRDQLAAIRELIAAGQAASISGFVQHAIGLALDDVAGWPSLLAEALASSGGPLTAAERVWADEFLSSGAALDTPAA